MCFLFFEAFFSYIIFRRFEVRGNSYMQICIALGVRACHCSEQCSTRLAHYKCATLPLCNLDFDFQFFYVMLNCQV
jgi:hypothetical protein